MTVTISARWVPDDYGQYWRACSTQQAHEQAAPKHPPVPPWLTNAIYDYRTKETWWQFLVRVSGLDEAIRRRQAFLDGFLDCRGNWWCGQCFGRGLLIEAGEALGYPDMHALYAHPQTRGRTGYEGGMAGSRASGERCPGGNGGTRRPPTLDAPDIYSSKE